MPTSSSHPSNDWAGRGPSASAPKGTVVASPAGHGMMWGPAVAEVAADLTTTGRCNWLDPADLGLDRFDADGNSRLAPEPISLPFPEKAAM